MNPNTDAHAILNAAREGQNVPEAAITQALRETGDLEPSAPSAVPSGRWVRPAEGWIDLLKGES